MIQAIKRKALPYEASQYRHDTLNRQFTCYANQLFDGDKQHLRSYFYIRTLSRAATTTATPVQRSRREARRKMNQFYYFHIQHVYDTITACTACASTTVEINEN